MGLRPGANTVWCLSVHVDHACTVSAEFLFTVGLDRLQHRSWELCILWIDILYIHVFISLFPSFFLSLFNYLFIYMILWCLSNLCSFSSNVVGPEDMIETGSGKHHRNRISSSISMHPLDAHGNASQEVKRLREAVALVHPDGCSGDGGRGIAMHYPSHASGRRADQLRFSGPVQNVGCIPRGAPGGGWYFWIVFGLRQRWWAWCLEILWAL